jgi:hypothetical protein
VRVKKTAGSDIQAGISIGPRSGHPPYPRAHVFAPMGGS